MPDIDYKCWFCFDSYNNFQFFCIRCKKIQKPSEINSFRIFGLEYEFLIDLKSLETSYFLLQSKLHPDKFINASDEEQLYSQIHSSNLNNSYKKLVDEITRAEELLECFGKNNSLNKSFTDTDMLNEIMEIQDESENLKNLDEKKIFNQKISHEINQLISELDISFKERKFDKANSIKVRISYLKKIIKNIKEY